MKNTLIDDFINIESIQEREIQINPGLIDIDRNQQNTLKRY